MNLLALFRRSPKYSDVQILTAFEKALSDAKQTTPIDLEVR